jgi:hypothetical protein
VCTTHTHTYKNKKRKVRLIQTLDFLLFLASSPRKLTIRVILLQKEEEEVKIIEIVNVLLLR